MRKLLGLFRYVPHDRVAWYLARGWQPVDLGHYHGQFSVGMWKPTGPLPKRKWIVKRGKPA